MTDFLEHFYDLTLRVSVQSRPTSHTYFHEIAEVLLLLREMGLSEDNLSKEMAIRMLVKFYKYWGEKYGERQGDREERKIRGISCSTLMFSSVLLLILDINCQIALK